MVWLVEFDLSRPLPETRAGDFSSLYRRMSAAQCYAFRPSLSGAQKGQDRANWLKLIGSFSLKWEHQRWLWNVMQSIGCTWALRHKLLCYDSNGISHCFCLISPYSELLSSYLTPPTLSVTQCAECQCAIPAPVQPLTPPPARHCCLLRDETKSKDFTLNT